MGNQRAKEQGRRSNHPAIIGLSLKRAPISSRHWQWHSSWHHGLHRERAHAIKAEKFTICVAGLYNAVRNKRDHCVYFDFSVSV
jgi:hypothetical protein